MLIVQGWMERARYGQQVLNAIIYRITVDVMDCVPVDQPAVPFNPKVFCVGNPPLGGLDELARLLPAALPNT